MLPRLALIFSAAALLLSGCAARKYASLPFTPVQESSFETVRYWPSNGVETTAQIGDAMVKAYAVAVMPAIVVENPVQYVTHYRDNLRMMLELEPGKFELVGHDTEGGRYFAAWSGIKLAYESNGAFPDPELLSGGIHISQGGTTSIYWFWSGTHDAALSAAPPILYTGTVQERPPREARFQRELVYSGMSQSSLSLLYREFLEERARPAFSQELKYDFTPGTVIGYKGARFEILNAGNTSVTYRVVTPLANDAK